MNIRNALLKFAYNKKLRIMGQIIKNGKKVSLHRNDNRRSNQKGWENMETAKYAKIWEEDVVIPTYEIGAPDKNPMFLEKRVYQGSIRPQKKSVMKRKTRSGMQYIWKMNI